MQPNDRPADREAEGGVDVAFDRSALECRHELLALRAREAIGIVLDGHENLVAAPLGAHADDSARGRGLGAVLEQARQCVFDERCVNADLRQIALHVDYDAVRRKRCL